MNNLIKIVSFIGLYFENATNYYLISPGKKQFIDSKKYKHYFVNGTNFYKSESRDIYIHGCCHVNDLGNRIFKLLCAFRLEH